MMSMEVLEEQWLNSCWLSCSMPLVDLIPAFGLFLKYNLLGIEVISNPNCLGKDPWEFSRFRDEKRRRKVKFRFDKPWGTALAKVP